MNSSVLSTLYRLARLKYFKEDSFCITVISSRIFSNIDFQINQRIMHRLQFRSSEFNFSLKISSNQMFKEFRITKNFQRIDKEGVVICIILNQSNMKIEQNKQAALKSKYNLFSPNKCIDVCRGYSGQKKEKVQIKLIFHHPNLLFLNSKKIRSKEEASKEVGDFLIKDIKERSKHLGRSSSNFRPFTSYQTNKEPKESIRMSTMNTPFVRRSHTEEALQICGKSSCMTNELIRLSKSNFRTIKTSNNNTFQGSHHEQVKDENLFKMMQGKCGEQKKHAWNELIHNKANKYAVRLNMYFDIEKKYQKYVTKCR